MNSIKWYVYWNGLKTNFDWMYVRFCLKLFFKKTFFHKLTQEAQNDSDDEKQEEDLKPDVCQRNFIVFWFIKKNTFSRKG